MRVVGTLGILLALSPLASAASGGTPVQVRWSGRLLDAVDAPVNRSAVPFGFRIIDSAVAGAVEWQATCALDVRGGYVAPVLGSGPCAGDGLDTNDIAGDRWLEVVVDGVPLAPRMPLTPVPRALAADHALTADSAQTAVNATNAVNAQTAQNAVNATNATSAQTAQNAVNATTAATATTALDAQKLGGVAASEYVRTTALSSALSTSGSATIHAGNISGGTIGSSLVGGVYAGQVSFTNPANTFAGDFTGTFHGTFDGTFAGGIKIPNDTGRTSCAAADKGALYYDNADGQVRVCNGSQWKRISVRPPGLAWSVSTVALGTFTNVTTANVTLTNTGDAAVTSVSVAAQWTQGTGTITITSNTCGATLEAGATCAVAVRLSATSAGTMGATVTATSGNAGSATATLQGTAQLGANCRAIKAAGITTSGVYTVDFDGAGADAPVSVYCEMQVGGGGWTLVTNRRGGSSNTESCGPNLATFLGSACGTPSSIGYGDSYSLPPSRAMASAPTEWLIAQYDSSGTLDSDDAYIVTTTQNLLQGTASGLFFAVTKACDLNGANCDSSDVLWRFVGDRWYPNSDCSGTDSNDASYRGNYGLCHAGGGSYYSSSLFGNRSGYDETKLWGHSAGTTWHERVFVR